GIPVLFAVAGQCTISRFFTPDRVGNPIWPVLVGAWRPGERYFGTTSEWARFALPCSWLRRDASFSAVEVEAIDLGRTDVADRQWLPVRCPAYPRDHVSGRPEVYARDLLQTAGGDFDPISVCINPLHQTEVDIPPVAGPLGKPGSLLDEFAPLPLRRVKNVEVEVIEMESDYLLLIRRPDRGEQIFGARDRL